MILRYFRGPGAHFGDPGPHFGDFSDFWDFEDTLRGKVSSFLTSKCGHKSTFCNRIFLMFFERSVLEIFRDFGHLRLHFGSHFDDFLREMSFRKNSWKCVTVINFRGLTPPKWSFFASPNDGCALRVGFYEIFVILVRSGLPFRGLLGTNRSTKKGLKNNAKKWSKKGL